MAVTAPSSRTVATHSGRTSTSLSVSHPSPYRIPRRKRRSRGRWERCPEWLLIESYHSDWLLNITTS